MAKFTKLNRMRNFVDLQYSIFKEHLSEKQTFNFKKKKLNSLEKKAFLVQPHDLVVNAYNVSP